MPDINLASGSQQVALLKKRQRNLYILSFLVIVTVAVIWLGVMMYESQLQENLDDVRSKVREVERQIAQREGDEERIRRFESRLQSIQQLLDSQVAWNPLLEDVENLLPVQTVLGQMSVSMENASVDVQAEAPNVDDVAATIASFKDSDTNPTIFQTGSITGVSKVDADNVAPEETRYSFDLQLTFNTSRLQDR